MTDPLPSARPPARKLRRERLWSKCWLSVRHVERFLRANAGRCLGRGIDYGCGEMPYAALVREHCDELLGVDVAQTASGCVDLVVPPDTPLPLADASLDFALCTQVLEHLRAPAWHVAELARVLRPGGVLLLTAPFVFEQHEVPHDYWRFTEFGLRQLAEAQGFDIVSLAPGGGMFETIAQVAIFRLPSLGPFDVLVYGPCNLLAAALDRLVRLDRITCNWHAVLRRR